MQAPKMSKGLGHLLEDRRQEICLVYQKGS